MPPPPQKDKGMYRTLEPKDEAEGAERSEWGFPHILSILFLWDVEPPPMAVPPSVVAHSSSSSSFLPFISSLSFSLLFLLLLILYLRNKKRGHPRLGCREREHHHLRRDLSAWDPSPQPSEDGGEKDAAAAAEPAGSEDKGRRKKARKKRGGGCGGSEGGDDDRNAAAACGMGEVRNRRMERIYPFSSFASSTQRRIKLQYDEIVESNKAKTLTVAQVFLLSLELLAFRVEILLMSCRVRFPPTMILIDSMW
ncbi:hypothetical protein BHE74_00021833 [Ensete ventricosum]|nr:hypothetical protein BHE74_00021833 [Ensete ventricosum]